VLYLRKVDAIVHRLSSCDLSGALLEPCVWKHGTTGSVTASDAVDIDGGAGVRTIDGDELCVGSGGVSLVSSVV
jgi:hypothetical protein